MLVGVLAGSRNIARKFSIREKREFSHLSGFRSARPPSYVFSLLAAGANAEVRWAALARHLFPGFESGTSPLRGEVERSEGEGHTAMHEIQRSEDPS